MVREQLGLDDVEDYTRMVWIRAIADSNLTLEGQLALLQ